LKNKNKKAKNLAENGKMEQKKVQGLTSVEALDVLKSDIEGLVH
jgi:hypothetical protein